MSQRYMFVLSFLTVVAVLGMGYYLEYYQNFIPCPLCTLQRLCFVICGIFFALGILTYKSRIMTTLINFSVMLFSGLGMFLAGRQIWIQMYASADSSECGISLEHMLTILPWQDVMQKVFSGSAECSQRGWELLGINIPEWSLIIFTAFLLSAGYFFIKGLCFCSNKTAGKMKLR